ncbi:MAG: multicopper oxidase domain-containing protein, partial [Hyphomicrobiales bacterium]|nr:multicopper oxidase domain-containing protein [Hyphomicrobiales bacterium]
MITRRGFIQGVATGAIAMPSVFRQAVASQASQLPVPPLIDAARTGGRFAITAKHARHAFLPGKPTATFGYSASYLGPTLRVRRGDKVAVDFANQLGRLTTVHWHGLKVPGNVDGGPHNRVLPGRSWKPVLTIDQPAATAWYHPHPHGETAYQVYGGLAGMIIIDDDVIAKLPLPASYGVDDLPVVIQDRSFASDGGLLYGQSPMATMMGSYGDTVIVNGAVRPRAVVPTGLVRLRILDGANARAFRLGFSDARKFHVIASDGGLLAAPIELTELTIAPGERYEVVVDFSDGRAAELVSLDVDTGFRGRGMMGMMMGGAGQQGAGSILHIAPDRSRTGAGRLPDRLADVPDIHIPGSVRRRFLSLDMMMGGGGMMGGMMGRGGRGAALGINGRAFDMERIDMRAELNKPEIWTVRANMMGHPFHVHGALFRILSLNGRKPPAHQAGWKDTVYVTGEAEILTIFEKRASEQAPYMFHCHILEHE